MLDPDKRYCPIRLPQPPSGKSNLFGTLAAGTPVTTESEFDSELGSGQITQRMVAQGVRLSLAIITVEPTPEGSAEIKLYTLKGWSSIGVKAPTLDRLRSWIKGDQSSKHLYFSPPILGYDLQTEIGRQRYLEERCHLLITLAKTREEARDLERPKEKSGDYRFGGRVKAEP